MSEADSSIFIAPREGAALWAARFTLLVLILIVFGRAVGFASVDWDDQETIFANPILLPPGAHALGVAWTRPQLSLYVPITHTTWALLAMLGVQETSPGVFEIHPAIFHAFNLLVHLATTLLVFEVARRVLKHFVAALVAAAIFAVHPLQVEPVCWISGTKDLLAGFFACAAILAAMNAGSRDAFRRWIALAWLCAAAAMLSKPQAVIVPLLVLLVLCAKKIPWRTIALVIGPMLLMSAATALIACAVQPASSIPPTPIWFRPIVAGDAIGFYLAKIFLPLQLCVDYGRTPAAIRSLASVWCTVAAALVLLIAIVFARRRLPNFALGVIIALAAILPIVGFLPFEFQWYSTTSDRYLYTAMLGVALAAGATIDWLTPRIAGRTLTIVTAALVLALVSLSFAQAGVWRDTQSLFTHALAVNPTSLAANRVLAFEAARTGNDDRAIALLHVAQQFHPDDSTVYFNLANAYARQGKLDDAIAAFHRAIALRPNLANFHHNLAIALIRKGDFESAARELNRAIQLDPSASDSIRALAKLLATTSPTAQ